MIEHEIIEFLKERGFMIEKLKDGFDIEIGHRSVGAGLNEIFVETDELKAFEQLGDLVKIIYVNNAIRLNIIVRGENRQKKEKLIKVEGENKGLPSVKERVEAKIEEKGKEDTS